MSRRIAAVIAAIYLLIAADSLRANGFVTIRLISPQANATLAPGSQIDWRIEAEVSEGDNAGLALILVDLVQSAGNPQLFDLAPAVGVPSSMVKFAAPSGFANPGGGYAGTLDGEPGARNLRQIGGAQNGFGQAGAIMGQSVDVDAEVGQPGPITIAEGSFSAPGTSGSYAVSMENIVVNTFDAVNTAPAASPVSPAAALPVVSTLFFTVDDTIQLRGDLNCDGVVDGRDVAPFSLALVDAASYPGTYPFCQLSQADVNNDLSIDTNDISDFVACLLTGCP
ncbi:MAG: hypothetical protein H6818_19655 [Phycisphaerales bacterium]|nr:hypothetical protein [Phycisphaerales bacterium]MCB9863683.1 hypothetical protein [Phycisphaerales bacterium]